MSSKSLSQDRRGILLYGGLAACILLLLLWGEPLSKSGSAALFACDVERFSSEFDRRDRAAFPHNETC